MLVYVQLMLSPKLITVPWDCRHVDPTDVFRKDAFLSEFFEYLDAV